MSGRLSDKVCIITGTGGSMGRAAALSFAHENALVVGCDVNVAAAEATAAMVRARGGTMSSMQPCHLTGPADCRALVDFAVRTYGRIDVLFNNAAMAYFNWLEDISDEGWDRNRRREVDVVVLGLEEKCAQILENIRKRAAKIMRGSEIYDLTRR